MRNRVLVSLCLVLTFSFSTILVDECNGIIVGLYAEGKAVTVFLFRGEQDKSLGILYYTVEIELLGSNRNIFANMHETVTFQSPANETHGPPITHVRILARFQKAIGDKQGNYAEWDTDWETSGSVKEWLLASGQTVKYEGDFGESVRQDESIVEPYLFYRLEAIVEVRLADGNTWTSSKIFTLFEGEVSEGTLYGHLIYDYFIPAEVTQPRRVTMEEYNALRASYDELVMVNSALQEDLDSLGRALSQKKTDLKSVSNELDNYRLVYTPAAFLAPSITAAAMASVILYKKTGEPK